MSIQASQLATDRRGDVMMIPYPKAPKITPRDRRPVTEDVTAPVLIIDRHDATMVSPVTRTHRLIEPHVDLHLAALHLRASTNAKIEVGRDSITHTIRESGASPSTIEANRRILASDQRAHPIAPAPDVVTNSEPVRLYGDEARLWVMSFVESRRYSLYQWSDDEGLHIDIREAKGKTKPLYGVVVDEQRFASPMVAAGYGYMHLQNEIETRPVH